MLVMSIGVVLVCVELIMMLIILLLVPKEYAGASFIGFAIGESLGASSPYELLVVFLPKLQISVLI